MGRKGRKKKEKVAPDPVLTQIAEGIRGTTERTVGTASALFTGDTVHRDYRGDTFLYFNPLDDPVNFLRRPFGTSAREQMRYHLCRAQEHVAGVLEYARKEEWLLSKEDRDYLEEVFWHLDRIYPRKKG